MNKNKLSVRNKIKSRKPLFQRQDTNIFKQFRGEWRKPKGIHSKLRRGFRGHGMIPSTGYSGPRGVRGLTWKGLKPILVSNVKDLEKVTSEDVIVISSTVGTKKKVLILNEVKKSKLNISGMKDIDTFLSEVNEKLNSKKKESLVKKEEKKKKIEEASKVEKPKEEKKDESKK